MEQGKSHHDHQLFQDSWFQYQDHMMKKKNNNMNDDKKCSYSSSTSTSSIGQESTISNGSTISSSDIADDASSSSSASSPFSSGRALYDLSEIMAQLPIKRGLSKFYQGKSESFTSLSRVTSIEDLAKKSTPYRRNLKASKSCATGLNRRYKPYTLPKAKETTRASSFSSKSGNFTPLHKDLEC